LTILEKQCVNNVEQKKNSIHPIKEKVSLIVSFNSETGANVAKLPRGFNITGTMLTTTFKNKGKIISHFFLSEYTRQHDIQ